MKIKIYDDNDKEISTNEIDIKNITIMNKEKIFIKIKDIEDVDLSTFDSIRRQLIILFPKNEIILMDSKMEIHKGEKII